ncbi:hypothetical protein U8326_04905 [Tsuneonella sp. CC-YZS046]|uniref:hypothetical protein n=1 Tax=Tsuneonella sp. CC-YZS046 TaxID=3042152 RepID=UPI002D7A0015|nr:hypothetical protein [Tsuneonella sp. CC-YZS046]WRO67505.1 hypothetical protein U8326_04905 [Tsuneonella sp. CC-YZS046]
MRRRRHRPARWPAYRRVPCFTPVPLRARRDGWTPERQARFLGWLAQTGCVAKAAAKLGMARETAYRLRRREGAGSFAHAWDAVMTIRGGGEAPRRKVTLDERWMLAMEGGFVVRMRRGRFLAAWRKPSTSALLSLLASYDRALRRHDLWA